MAEAQFDVYEPMRELEPGQTYEWPDIRYYTQERSCLRMTYTASGWLSESYRGHPFPIGFGLGHILTNMILANPCFRIWWQYRKAFKRTHVGAAVHGGVAVWGGNMKRDLIETVEHEDGWIQEIYGEWYVPKGGQMKVEMREAVR